MDEYIFSGFRELLEQGGIGEPPAECHGVLCGLLCSHPDTRVGQWLTLLREESAGPAEPRSAAAPLPQRVQARLEDLYHMTVQQINSEDFAFRMLLPEDDVPLPQRAQGLADWCRGFLYGLGASTERPQQAMPAEVTEVLGDLAEISRLAHDEEQEAEQDEVAYSELVEYVRMGVLLVYQSLQPGAMAPDSDDRTVH